MNTSNKVILSGKIETDLICSHEVYNEKFYQTTLSVRRLSDITDSIPVQISERLLCDIAGKGNDEQRAMWQGIPDLSQGQMKGTMHGFLESQEVCQTNDQTVASVVQRQEIGAGLFKSRSLRQLCRENSFCASQSEEGDEDDEQGADISSHSLPLFPAKKLQKGIMPLGANDFITLEGQFRSYNKMEQQKSRLMLTVFAQNISVGFDDFSNSIELTGYICKPPIYRTTPFMREICDCLIAVNRAYNKSDYIPCIAWGRNARFLRNMTVGQQVSIAGRIQSRLYNKKLVDGSEQSRVAYEVSIAKISLEE